MAQRYVAFCERHVALHVRPSPPPLPQAIVTLLNTLERKIQNGRHFAFSGECKYSNIET